MILINGESHSQLAISDRGFQYGDGLFETIEVYNGRLIFIEQHLKRLALGCEKLRIPAPDREQLIHEAQSLIQNSDKAVLKIIITRGGGGRGYKMPDLIQPTRVLSLHPFPDYPLAFQQQGVKAIFCQQRLGLNPTLAGLKHLNRLEQILARAEWDTPTIQEGLLLDLNGYLIEGTMSNVFFVKDTTLYTPSLWQAGIAGILRDFVLQTATLLGVNTVQGLFKPEQLFTADEIFLTNSVIGIWAVKDLTGFENLSGLNTQRCYPVGKLTRTLQARLAQFKQQVIST
jgi:4-amino-4-deoxychorismate lyase